MKNKMGFNATWSMAVGGMVGGGIFSVLGVVVDLSGQWAWLSFVLAGIISIISAHGYSQLSIKYQQSGGAFTFLKEINHKKLGGGLSWVLIVGYILTISVYAFTFGHYVAHVFHAGAWLPKFLAFSVIAILALVNLRGVGDASMVEIITVWGKLAVLLGLSAYGLYLWNPEALSEGMQPKSWTTALMGAATIFMAYEGFQLLSYDYEDIENAEKTLPRAMMTAVIAVIAIYVMVSLGATMLVGAKTLIEQEEVALAVAGKQAFGMTGLILVTIAAAFSTGSAINATLFSTGRLMERVANEHVLPSWLSKENKSGIPWLAIVIIAGFAGLLSAIGSLSTLVDAASLIFLVTFGTVNFIAFREKIKWHWLSLIGFGGCLAAAIASTIRQFQINPVAIGIVLFLLMAAFFGSPLILKSEKD
ncbi:MAG: amino acid permease [Saprospiraceae bacterium]|nr:amino acid permease [Saprospiraceae bacterium]